MIQLIFSGFEVQSEGIGKWWISDGIGMWIHFWWGLFKVDTFRILSSSHLITIHSILYKSHGSKSPTSRFWTSWEFLCWISTDWWDTAPNKNCFHQQNFYQVSASVDIIFTMYGHWEKRTLKSKTRIWQQTDSTFGQLRVFEITEGCTNSLLNSKIS